MTTWGMWNWIFMIISSAGIFIWFISKDYVNWYSRLPDPKPKNKTWKLVGVLTLDMLISIVCGIIVAQILSIFQEVFG